MRKGYLAIFLVLMMAIGVASSAQAYDNMAEPSAALLIPFVYANTDTVPVTNPVTGVTTYPLFPIGYDTAIAVNNLPNALPKRTVIDWSFFDAVTSAHLRDKKITITPGAIGGGSFTAPTTSTGMLWSIAKGPDPALDDRMGYLVFAFPELDSSSLVANAFFVDGGINFAAFIPTLQLVPGEDIFSIAATDPANVDPVTEDNEIRNPDVRIWSSPRSAINGIPYGATIFPRYTITTLTANDGSVLTTDSAMAFWKPGTGKPTSSAIQWNTINEAQTSCEIPIPGELALLDPFLDVTGGEYYPEGAFLINDWPEIGGISWTFILGAKGGTVVEAQTVLTPHWGSQPIPVE